MPTGTLNAITDVAGVHVGHATLIDGDSIRTGVTAIVPADGNLFQQKLPAAVFVGNGFGKLAGALQVNELGNLETPIVLTNTLSVATAIEALVDYTLAPPRNETVQSVNALVGETNDGVLNDIRAGPFAKNTSAPRSMKRQADASSKVASARERAPSASDSKAASGRRRARLPVSLGGFTVGVLVQSNFGGVADDRWRARRT